MVRAERHKTVPYGMVGGSLVFGVIGWGCGFMVDFLRIGVTIVTSAGVSAMDV